MVLFNAGDVAQGLTHQIKAVIINERIHGIDSQQTYHSYSTLGVMYHNLHKTEQSLNYWERALLLGSTVAGVDHPDLSSTLVNVSTVLQEEGEYKLSLRVLKLLLNSLIKQHGPEPLHAASTYHLIAISYSLQDKFKKAYEYEKLSHAIFQKAYGDRHLRTIDSNIWLKQFLNKAVQTEKEKRKNLQTLISNSVPESGQGLSNSKKTGFGATTNKSIPGSSPNTPLTPSTPNVSAKPLSEILNFIQGPSKSAKKKK
jgi:tetratricopeptide (TPR) repeat protein